ncbi:lipid II flippase MurJ [Alloscardovia macacae]|uniref:Lipid II flippase MurJ n=1 Tax=Alloscardovia macacae TaxID=1160091 RepID=A0A1Y2T096_9BIFI|nr:lipid II flippase MurJ [Alloscardovia macacae]OTA26832.1 lipid II flippase MurJ [Alloscardovia macacae]OTA29144.1 lipid II flippase MurJ [Alloscardovia macacae]
MSSEEEVAKNSVRRNSLIMASGTLASRLTGMIRTILLAAAVGTTGIAANAYQTGSSVPQIVYTLISGGLFNAILVPQIVRTLKSEDSKKHLDKLVTLSILLLLGITAIMMLGTNILTSIFLSSSWTGPQRALANAFTLWCTPQIFFYGLYTVLGQILAAKDKFTMYAWSSVAANVVSSAGFIVFLVLFGNASRQPLEFWTADKIALTAGTWTLGVAVQALLLFIPLIRSGYRFGFSWGFRGIGLRSMGSVAVWSLAITVMMQITSIITSRIASGAPLAAGDEFRVAGNGSYQNAMSIYILPYSLFAVSLVTATFPQISSFVAEHKLQKASEVVSRTMRSSSLIMFFFTSVMLAIPLELAAVFLPSVDGEQMMLLSPIIFTMTLGLPFTSLVLLAQRTFYAFEDGKSPFIIQAVQSAIMVAIQVGIWLLAPAQIQTSLLGLAVSVSYIVCIPLLLVMVYRRFRGDFAIGHLVVVHIKILLASVGAYVASEGTEYVLSALLRFNPSTSSGRTAWFVAVFICAVVALVGFAAYALVLVALGTREFTDGMRAVLARLSSLPILPALFSKISSVDSSTKSSRRRHAK